MIAHGSWWRRCRRQPPAVAAARSRQRARLAQAQQATGGSTTRVGEAAGYRSGSAGPAGRRVHRPAGPGGMGVHYVNGALSATRCSTRRGPRRSSTSRSERRLGLAALEYIVFKAAWDATHGPPTLFGRASTSRRAEPLRAAGVLRAPRLDLEAEPERAPSAWNPKVSCRVRDVAGV